MLRRQVTVNLWTSRDVAPSARVQININTQNAPVVRLSATPIDGQLWLKTRLFLIDNNVAPEPVGEPVASWDARIADKGQVPNPNNADTYYSRQVNLPKLKPGVYIIRARAGTASAWSVVNVTNLAIIVKRSAKRMLVWVTDALDGRVKSGAHVAVYRRDQTRVAQAVTGVDGATEFPLGTGQSAVLVANGPDLAGVESDARSRDGRLITHFQTDRPIYRPGQTVSYKAILRLTQGRGYTVAGSHRVRVELRDPKDDVIDQKSTTTNGMGSLQGVFDLPTEAMPGSYTLVVIDGNRRVFQSFEVAEYRKPEFQASITPVKARYLAGEHAQFKVHASYYFGAPVPNANVRYQVRSEPSPYTFGDRRSDYDDGNLYPRNTYGGAPFVSSDEVQTDDKGDAVINLNTLKSAPDVNYVVTATVIDGSRRQVAATGSVPVYAAAKRIGIATDVIVATLGSLIPIDLRVVDLDGAPVTARVRLRLYRQDWNEKTDEIEEHVIAATQVLVPPTGKLRYNLPAREAGQLIVEAKCDDGTGRAATSRMYLEVAGNFGRNTMRNVGPIVGIKLDRAEYAPGDTVHAYVTTNNPGRPMLVVAEGRDIWNYRVITPSKGGQLWTLPTNLEMSPDATVTACQWEKGHLFAGSQPLLLPDASRRLAVSVTPDRSDYRPGDKATMLVRVRDNKGRPVKAEISLDVVDASIYAVSPDTTADPYDVFWSPRGDFVSTVMSAPEELSGGAYQGVAASAPIRSRFADTALWAGIVDTDGKGEAKLTFEMPGNLTTWRAMAYGVDGDTQVGRGEASVLANRAVMLRLASPRQIVVGDRLTMIGTVNNRTAQEHIFKVKLSADGVSLLGASEQSITVGPKAEGRVEWVLNPGGMPVSGNATLTASVACVDQPSVDNSDALQVSLPVTPKAVRETTLTGGVLGKSARFVVRIPANRIEPATVVKVLVRGNLSDVAKQTTESLLRTGRYGTPIAIDQIVVAAATKQSGDRKEVRDSLAMLARDQSNNGWGWWQDSPTDPPITARALRGLTEARYAGLPVYDRMYQSAIPGAESLWDQINLWEYRALLASSLVEASSKRSRDMVGEITRRGKDLSPFARLRLAEAEHILGDDGKARELLAGVVKLVSAGPESSYIPVGEGFGWSASSAETSAEALYALSILKTNAALQAKLAHGLALSENSDWRTEDDQAAIVRALTQYSKAHPSAESIGPVTLTVNGTAVPTWPAKVGEGATATIPRELLKAGDNVIVLGRTSPGETFVSLETRVYIPRLGESTQGIRALRRIEVQNEAGIWIELNRVVKAGEPVRITMVAWGDDLPDAMRVIDPIPAGFEFVSDESEGWGREEVRDGAVIHYLTNSGQPQTFRYYIRAESEGRLNVLPASAEFLRRPTTKGQTTSVIVSVQK